jgi:hypothetical protein
LPGETEKMNFFRLLILVFFLLLPCSAEAETRFFTSLYDVPVMPGLTEVVELALVFDKPGGRIAEAAAFSKNTDEAAIRRFYTASLSQMGWQAAGEGRYRREGEILEISFEKSNTSPDNRNMVYFTLRPAE